MKNNFLKNFLIVVTVFFLAIIEQIFLPSMGIFFLGQWPIFILIFILNFWQKNNFPLFCALLAGASIDFISALHLVFLPLAYFVLP